MKVFGRKRAIVINGILTGDTEGGFTYHRSRRASIVDFAIANVEAAEKI